MSNENGSIPVRAAGWRILVEPVEVKRETDGGIALPEEAIRAQEHLRYIGRVVDVGELAYAGDRFKPHPNATLKPWCKIGDTVAFGRYAGQEVIAHVCGEAKRYRLINDDEVLAVVNDPAAIVTPL
ncbi:MAG: co-chaperone GroES [Actinobacteria bacterium]|nr:MAG: co-chaperone GroES [Actinomycetota bacterium]